MKEHFDTASAPRLAGGKFAMEVKKKLLGISGVQERTAIFEFAISQC
jgi:hypothetical protein